MAEMRNLAVRGTHVRGEHEDAEGERTVRGAADRRVTMPKGGYKFGASNPKLRPDVPKGK